MSRLEEFLALPNVNDVVEEIYVNKRLGTFKVKPMTNQQYNEYLSRCRGKFTKEGVNFDNGKYNLLIVSNHVIDPNFADAEFLQRAGFTNPRDFINAKFKAGEIQDIAEKIAEISGIGGDLSEKVEEAKNS